MTDHGAEKEIAPDTADDRVHPICPRRSGSAVERCGQMSRGSARSPTGSLPTRTTAGLIRITTDSGDPTKKRRKKKRNGEEETRVKTYGHRSSSPRCARFDISTLSLTNSLVVTRFDPAAMPQGLDTVGVGPDDCPSAEREAGKHEFSRGPICDAGRARQALLIENSKKPVTRVAPDARLGAPARNG